MDRLLYFTRIALEIDRPGNPRGPTELHIAFSRQRHDAGASRQRGEVLRPQIKPCFETVGITAIGMGAHVPDMRFLGQYDSRGLTFRIVAVAAAQQTDKHRRTIPKHRHQRVSTRHPVFVEQLDRRRRAGVFAQQLFDGIGAGVITLLMPAHITVDNIRQIGGVTVTMVRDVNFVGHREQVVEASGLELAAVLGRRSGMVVGNDQPAVRYERPDCVRLGS